MFVDAFDYLLPKELIAQTPSEERDHSRLMVVHRASGQIEHRFFYNLPEYLGPRDLLVLNNTRVRAARLFGRKETGGAVEVLLLKPAATAGREADSGVWEALLHSRKKLRAGCRITMGSRLNAEVLGLQNDGIWQLRLNADSSIEPLIEELGRPPLPPYIKRQKTTVSCHDRDRYQTVYAARTGSAAAPTAGLHFTTKLLDEIVSKGIEILSITLHVGLGTFQPVRVPSLEQHHMHSEFYEVEPATAKTLLDAQRSRRRVVACGTTSVRVIETLRTRPDSLRGDTDLFIYPGYSFGLVQAMITNFHLPRSTLLMLVAAFAGQDLIFQAYQQAIERQYRFYSYGDAMLIL